MRSKILHLRTRWTEQSLIEWFVTEHGDELFAMLPPEAQAYLDNEVHWKRKRLVLENIAKSALHSYIKSIISGSRKTREKSTGGEGSA